MLSLPSLFLHLLVSWLVFLFLACTRMEQERLERGHDLLGMSKKGKDASKKMQAHKGAMFIRLGGLALAEWFSLSLSKPLL